MKIKRKYSKRTILGIFATSLLLFSVTFFSNITLYSNAYTTEITVPNTTFVIDIGHGSMHPEVINFVENLTYVGNTVIVCDGTFILPDNTTALFLSSPTLSYTLAEKELIRNWLAGGNKTLFIGGDSDYDGSFSPTAVNDLLSYIDSKLRLDATAIFDTGFNDGAEYRVCAEDYGQSNIAISTSEGCEAGIVLHGPCSILGYDNGDYLDLRSTTIENVEVLLSYSNYSYSEDMDLSNTELDYYNQSSFSGDYPAVICEKIEVESNHSCVILAGESIFADYKKMYDQFTVYGVYNGGIHYGQMFVNNIVNNFASGTLPTLIPEYSKIINQITLVFILGLAIIPLSLKTRRRL